MENRVEPVYLNGEIVGDVGVPDTVELRPVPDYEYHCVYINGRPVLMDASTRQNVPVYLYAIKHPAPRSIDPREAF